MGILQPHYIEITTCKLNGVYNSDISGFTISDSGFCTHKIYNSSGVEQTTQLTATLAGVFTVVDFMPTYSYMVLERKFAQDAPPSSDVRLWGFQDPNGLNIPFTQGGINLRLAGTGNGIENKLPEPAVLMYQSPTSEFNKIRIILNHGVGVQHTFGILLSLKRIP